jgi:hypothetical protein
LQRGHAPVTFGAVPALSQTQLLASIIAMIVLAVLYLRWIWLSEWSCRRCNRKNLECACSGRWSRYL